MKTGMRLGLLLALALSTSGCANLMCWAQCHTQERNASSLVDFLYPNGEAPPRDNAIPELRLPLRVGLAFLPSRESADGLDAAHKELLLQQIRDRFSSRKFVAQIEVIPTYYLQQNQHYAGLAAVQRLYKLDLMALVSYDQVAHVDANHWSLGYLTVVGAFVLKGSTHDVSTLVDLAVVDPATPSLVLRAGGVDTQHSNSSGIRETVESRELKHSGFDRATEQMVDNFDKALTDFERDVREGRGTVRIVRNENGSGTGSGGGGGFGWLTLAVLGAGVALRHRAERSRGARV